MANPKKGYPKRNEGANGDLSLNITPTGLGLFGKINNQWYRFGAAQEIGNKGRQNDKDNYFKQDVSLGNTSIQKQLKIGKNILETTLGGLGLSTSLKIKEASGALTDTPAYGQLWVKTATPNELYFTTDAGNDIQLTSGTTTAFVGDITSVVAGVGLSGGGTSSDVTLTLDMSELTDMTASVNSSEDELIILDNGADRRKLISEIPLSAFNNDSGFVTATLTTEEVQDIVGGMFSSNTETRVSATYVDGGVGAGKINLVVDDMTADTNTNQLTTFDVDADSGTAETIAHGNTLQLTGGTGISTTVSSTDTVTFALSSGAALSNLGGGSGTTFLKKDGTWATPTDTNTQNTTTLSFVDSSDDILLRNTTGGAGSGTDDIKFVAGSNITLTHTDADNITIASANTPYSVGDGGLTTNDFTNDDHTKLNGIEDNATADQTQSDINGLAITTVGTISSGTWQGTAIAHAYIGNDAIEGDNLADNAVDSEHYTDGSIDHVHLAGDCVDGDNLADNACDSEHYTDGSIDHVHLSGDAVDGDNIADDSINSEHYVDGSIDTAHIADDQVTYAKIQDVSATDRILGRDSSGAGVIEEISPSSLRTMINVENGSTADQTKSDIDGLAITTVGTIDTGTWEGTTIAVDQGGTGATSLNNLITLSTHTTGNYVATLTAGALIDLQNNTGEGATPTIDVDLTEAGEAAIANGDYILFLDGGATGTHAKEAVADLATLFAGTSLTASNSVIGVDDDFIKNDADDTMEGTLTINKSSTATTAGATYGQVISLNHTGNTASGNSITNEGIHIEITNHTGTHVGTHNTYGIHSAARSNTTGTSTVYGIVNTAQAGDTVYGIYNTSTGAGTTGYGIYQKVDDGDTDYIQVSSANIADYFSMSTTANGATTLSTVDDDAANADLTFTIDGDIHMNSASNINIEATNWVEFDGCGVGFDLVTPTYNASDTNVDFQTGNKQFVTFGSGNITDLNLIFPKTSGNFTLILKQDGGGSRTVTNYKVWDRDATEAASGSATVKFAGGSNPTLTTAASKTDIISFFYDADNEIAYGVASLNF